jgi:hypothetical protein
MALIRGRGSGATVTLVAGISTDGRSISGCVFFISTAGFVRGSGRTAMRAVSFFGAGITAAAARAGETRATGADGGGFAGDRVGR